MDSRTGQGTSPTAPFAGGVARNLQVTGMGGVPVSGVSAVVLNVTVVNPTTASHVTVWPAGGALPSSSNLNFVAGEIRPNLVTVGVGSGGAVSLRLNAGNADLIADVVGYYGDGTGFGASGSQYAPQSPYRILDSRPGGTGGYSTPWGPAATRDLTLTGVPADATVVVLNVTATNPTGATYATLWPSGVARPNASNLNVVPGQTSPNLVIVGIGANRKVSLYNDVGTTDYIADVAGWYGGSQANMVFTPASAPTRLLDSAREHRRLLDPVGCQHDARRDRRWCEPGACECDGGGAERDRRQRDRLGIRERVPRRRPAPHRLEPQLLARADRAQPGDGQGRRRRRRSASSTTAGSTDLVADVVGWFSASS